MKTTSISALIGLAVAAAASAALASGDDLRSPDAGADWIAVAKNDPPGETGLMSAGVLLLGIAPALDVNASGHVSRADFDDLPQGTALVRRTTGGGAIHHGDELTFSLAIDALV